MAFDCVGQKVGEAADAVPTLTAAGKVVQKLVSKGQLWGRKVGLCYNLNYLGDDNWNGFWMDKKKGVSHFRGNFRCVCNWATMSDTFPSRTSHS